MRALRSTVSAALWVLLAGMAEPAAVLAQDEVDEGPVNTLSDEPAPGEDSAPAEAPAPPSEAEDQKARELFEQGRAAYDNGEYRDAWDYFRQAYLLSRRPQLLYNVGQAADRLRKDREALEAFKLYVKRLPEAKNRKEVENRMRALEERLANAQGDGAQTASTDTGGDTQGLSQEELSIFGSEEAAKSTNSSGQPTRTGFYTRLAVGLGLLGDGLSDSAADSISSLTLASHIGLGYDLGEGLVLGGALAFDWGIAPSASAGGTSVDLRSARLTLVMAFVDYYLDPRRDGWHLLGGLGAGGLALSDDTATVGIETAGLGALVLGGGYEWPFGQEWALGAFGRLILAKGSTDTAGHSIAALSAMFTAVWY